LGTTSGSRWREAWETLRALAVAVVIALLIRQYVFETYEVKGYSMEPTLLNHERLLVNKFIYRFTRPQVGQIIVFQPPLPVHEDFVKRIVAVGGETVYMRDGRVYVDGHLQPEPYLPPAWRDHFTMLSGPVVVPKGDVWVLGDHRAASEDSRYFGPVPISSIRGEAILVWWPPQDARVL
jgi:signal peptidase I